MSMRERCRGSAAGWPLQLCLSWRCCKNHLAPFAGPGSSEESESDVATSSECADMMLDFLQGGSVVVVVIMREEDAGG